MYGSPDVPSGNLSPRPQTTQALQTSLSTNAVKQYKIYENPLGLREAVKQGWSWPAFFFTWIWALIKKMNVVGGSVIGGILVATVLFGVAGQGNHGDDANREAATSPAGEIFEWFFSLVMLALPVFFGVNGNAWREENLILRGYQLVGTIDGASDEAAIALYQGRQKAPEGNMSAGYCGIEALVVSLASKVKV